MESMHLPSALTSQFEVKSYRAPRLTALGNLQNFVLGDNTFGPDGDPEADSNQTS